MSADDDVMTDWLRERGYSILSPWHLAALDAMLHQRGSALARGKGIVWTDRLVHDVSSSGLDELHTEAQWEDARHVAAQSRARVTREQLIAHTSPTSNPAEVRVLSIEGVVLGASRDAPPTVRIEVWRRRRTGHRIVVMRLRPVAARRGRLTWVEESGEEWAGGEAGAVTRAEHILGWLTGDTRRRGLPALSGEEAAP